MFDLDSGALLHSSVAFTREGLEQGSNEQRFAVGEKSSVDFRGDILAVANTSVLAFDCTRGKYLLRQSLGELAFSASVALDADAKTLTYAATTGQTGCDVVCVELSSGAQLWRQHSSLLNAALCRVGGDRVLVGGSAGTITLSAATGAQLQSLRASVLDYAIASHLVRAEGSNARGVVCGRERTDVFVFDRSGAFVLALEHRRAIYLMALAWDRLLILQEDENYVELDFCSPPVDEPHNLIASRHRVS